MRKSHPAVTEYVVHYHTERNHQGLDAQGNTVQKWDATLPGRRPGPRFWAKMEIKEARAATGPELASPLYQNKLDKEELAETILSA